MHNLLAACANRQSPRVRKKRQYSGTKPEGHIDECPRNGWKNSSHTLNIYTYVQCVNFVQQLVKMRQNIAFSSKKIVGADTSPCVHPLDPFDVSNSPPPKKNKILTMHL